MVAFKTMLQDLGLSLAGQQHNGLHDALNILRVVQIMLADGCRLAFLPPGVIVGVYWQTSTQTVQKTINGMGVDAIRH